MNAVRAIVCVFLAIHGACAFAQEQSAWSAKKLQEFKGHNLEVRWAAVSPDGTLLATTASDRRRAEVKVWDVATGKELFAPDWPKNEVTGLIFSGDSQRLLVTGRVGPHAGVSIWDLSKRLAIGLHHDRFQPVALNHDGSRFGAVHYDKITVYESKSGNPALNIPVKDAIVSSVAFTADLKQFAVGNFQDIDFWDFADAKGPRVLGEQRGVVKTTAFSRDGKTLIAASTRNLGNFEYAGQVKCWDLAGGKERWTLAVPTRHVTALALSPDEKTLALIDWPGIEEKRDFLLVDVPAGKELLRLRENQRFGRPVYVDANRIMLPDMTPDKSVILWQIVR